MIEGGDSDYFINGYFFSDGIIVLGVWLKV